MVCFDTLGKDRQLTADDRAFCKRFVEVLRNSWESKEKALLEKDIDSQLRVVAENNEQPMQEVLNNLIDEEDKELPSSEEVEKHKNNDKLAELEMNTLRIDKLKEYIAEEKNVHFLETLLERRVIKFPEIIKTFYLFGKLTKEEVNYAGTNVLDWYKASKVLTKEQIYERMNDYGSRGCKPDVEVKPYAKWQRVLKNLEKYDLNVVATYNLYLAFVLRFLQLAGKVRVADQEARKANIKAEREAREERKKEAEQKALEKEERLQAAK